MSSEVGRATDIRQRLEHQLLQSHAEPVLRAVSAPASFPAHSLRCAQFIAENSGVYGVGIIVGHDRRRLIAGPQSRSTPRLDRREDALEGFSDAVFAFAITLLVVSLEVPKSYHDLMAVIRGFPAFAICFALIFQVWWRHYRFFRAYDFESDPYVVTLTGVLLFVVLFYTYPLKFVWSLPFSALEGRKITSDVITVPQVGVLFVIYGIGVVAVFAILGLMHARAYHERERLELSPIEVLDTRANIYSNAGVAGIGVLSIIIALAARSFEPQLTGIAGYIYCLIGVVEWRVGEYRGSGRAKLVD